ncbi:hypothetical protein CCACVL1_30958 [Corchorus capsularis]|uniref:BZIP domain-containing protein n=1 Tax=Corchorus capsularis TaxID=210143 RepID=A0A1R3FUK0_COCAP|nr:hypothetical protein CCACVL1_30958 [Corchorus capsularis]
MGDNSLDWAYVIGNLSDSDEIMSMIINDSKDKIPADKLQQQESQEGSKTLVLPAVQPYKKSHVIGDVEAGSSSGQTGMITSGGSLINPLGFPYRSQKQQQDAHSPPPPSESGIQSSPDQLLTPSVIPVNKRGKKATHGVIEAGEKKKLTMLKNRISAAKSRARRRVNI